MNIQDIDYNFIVVVKYRNGYIPIPEKLWEFSLLLKGSKIPDGFMESKFKPSTLPNISKEKILELVNKHVKDE